MHCECFALGMGNPLVHMLTMVKWKSHTVTKKLKREWKLKKFRNFILKLISFFLTQFYDDCELLVVANSEKCTKFDFLHKLDWWVTGVYSKTQKFTEFFQYCVARGILKNKANPIKNRKSQNSDCGRMELTLVITTNYSSYRDSYIDQPVEIYFTINIIGNNFIFSKGNFTIFLICFTNLTEFLKTNRNAHVDEKFAFLRIPLLDFTYLITA